MNPAKHVLLLSIAWVLLSWTASSAAFSVLAIHDIEISFEQDSDTMEHEQREALRDFADRVDWHQFNLVVVVGHASPTESDAQPLSERRAASTRLELIRLGIPPSSIYTEGNGDMHGSHATSARKAARVEIEYVGRPRAMPHTGGFNALWTWHRSVAERKAAPSFNTPRDAWDSMAPLEFLPAIGDPALRLRFLNKYRMVAIHEKDDVLLQKIESLLPDAAPPVDAQTALLAFALGTPVARSAFSSSLDSLDVTDAGARGLAEGLWCVGDWRSPLREPDMRRMKIPQMLRALSAPEQMRWARCAVAGRDATASLEFLKANGVNLSARDEQGRTALHAVADHAWSAAVRVLIAAGADPNAQDAEGRTPLHGLRNASYGGMAPPIPRAKLKETWDALVAGGANSMLQDHRGAVPAPIEP